MKSVYEKSVRHPGSWPGNIFWNVNSLTLGVTCQLLYSWHFGVAAGESAEPEAQSIELVEKLLKRGGNSSAVHIHLWVWSSKAVNQHFYILTSTKKWVLLKSRVTRVSHSWMTGLSEAKNVCLCSINQNCSTKKPRLKYSHLLNKNWSLLSDQNVSKLFIYLFFEKVQLLDMGGFLRCLYYYILVPLMLFQRLNNLGSLVCLCDVYTNGNPYQRPNRPAFRSLCMRGWRCISANVLFLFIHPTMTLGKRQGFASFGVVQDQHFPLADPQKAGYRIPNSPDQHLCNAIYFYPGLEWWVPHLSWRGSGRRSVRCRYVLLSLHSPRRSSLPQQTDWEHSAPEAPTWRRKQHTT